MVTGLVWSLEDLDAKPEREDPRSDRFKAYLESLQRMASQQPQQHQGIQITGRSDEQAGTRSLSARLSASGSPRLQTPAAVMGGDRFETPRARL